MSGGYVRKFSFQNSLSCNRKCHRTLCFNSTVGYVLGVSSGLATDLPLRLHLLRELFSGNHDWLLANASDCV